MVDYSKWDNIDVSDDDGDHDDDDDSGRPSPAVFPGSSDYKFMRLPMGPAPPECASPQSQAPTSRHRGSDCGRLAAPRGNAKPPQSFELAKRHNRILSQRARVVCGQEVGRQQQEMRARGQCVMITPPCTWCGLPTVCYCDDGTRCGKPVCTKCERDFRGCVQCFMRWKPCTEGDARQHASKLARGRDAQRESVAEDAVTSGVPLRSIDAHLEDAIGAQLAKRHNRILSQRTRAVCGILVGRQQQEMQARGKCDMITPPCTWCGLPTSMYCDDGTRCGKPVCTNCDSDIHACVQCFMRWKRCTEGDARQHASKLVRDRDAQRESAAEDAVTSGVPLRSIDADVEEAMATDGTHQAPITSHSEALAIIQEQHAVKNAGLLLLKPKGRHAPPPPSEEHLRQKSAAAVLLEEARRCREASAIVEEEALRRIEQEVKSKEQVAQRMIEEQNAAANELRKERRRGAGGTSAASTTAEAGHAEEQPMPAPAPDSARPVPSKKRTRKQNKKATALAGAKHKADDAAVEATRLFLRETAEGFVERPAQEYPISPMVAPSSPKADKMRRKASDSVDDVQLGVWEAKLKYPGITHNG